MMSNRPLPVWEDRFLVSWKELQNEVFDENIAQQLKWGRQTHTIAEWALILSEEYGELMKEMCESHFQRVHRPNLRTEAIQLATLALKVAEMSGQEHGQ